MTIGRTKNGNIMVTPEEGMGVTNGSTVAESTVYLGKRDSPENWLDCELSEEAQIDDYRSGLTELGVRLE